MTRILVVADDLTGGNGCAAGFARSGLRAANVHLGLPPDELTGLLDTYDVLVVTTDSRHLPPADAEETVRGVVAAAWPADLICSRADSTLRGNFGAEAQAVLAAVRERGPQAVGLCMPAFPQADRQTVDGLQLMAGKRLEDTELAHDVRAPVDNSSVEAALQRSTELRTAVIGLAEVTGSWDALVARFRAVLDDGVDVVVADALTDEHLKRTAEAAVAADPRVMWVGIDPGPGTLAIAHALETKPTGGSLPLLAIAGSATELTQLQLRQLSETRPVHLVRPVLDSNRPVPDISSTIAEVSTALENAGPGNIVLLASVLEESDILELTAEEAEEVPRRIGRITAGVLATARISGDPAAGPCVGGLYTTGGDITAAVLSALGAAGIEVHEEVVPLAAAGVVIGGEFAGLPIVTKGGLVGGPDTAVACLDHLSAMVRAQDRLYKSGSRED